MRYNPVMASIIDLTTQLRKRTTEEEEFSRSHFDTEIIHLQNYDNFYSMMDRLHQRDSSGQGTRRLLLVWPPRGRILETPAEFGKLRGWAVRNDYQIALVIPGNSIYIQMAAEQGIPAFKSVKEAGDTEWKIAGQSFSIPDPSERNRRLELLRKDVEESRRPRTSFGIRFFFFLLTCIVLAGTFYAILPHAKVEITPYLTRQTVNMTIWTDDRLNSPTLAGGIPTIEKKFELTLEASVPTSGQVKIESGIAVGEVVVRNICSRIYTSSAGVRVGTSEDFDRGINFITLEDASLAPDEERTLRIEAENGGADGNLPAGSIQFAEYPKSLCWEIRQEKPTAGGSEGVYAAPNDADQAAVREMISGQIADAAFAALENDPEGSDLLPLGQPVVRGIKREQMIPDNGFASDTLTLRRTLEVTIKAVRRSDMEAIIRGQSARLNAQTAGLTGYEILSGPREENGLSTWSVKAEYLVYQPETNEDALQLILRGKSLSQADQILHSFSHIQSFSISLLPSWLNRMPLAAQNIRVTIYPAIEEETK
ncbi:MAG: hypothetical protein IKP86_01230 [Anaerolineaceae bacterium]|nr:hypothetical protein [Anaerolineaceae bacterium]